MATRHHIPALDGLRGIAVLLVLSWHVEWSRVPGLPVPIDNAGWLGVDFFFVLSGFLITRILLYERENGGSLKRFYARRFSRILPVYLLALVAVMLISGQTEGLIWSLTYLYNYAPEPKLPYIFHTWSLCVEEHFYSIWPLIVWFLPLAASKRAAIWLASACMLGAIVYEAWRQHWYMDSGGKAIYFSTHFHAFPLLLGCFVAYVEPFATKHGVKLGLGCLALAVLGRNGIHVFSYYNGLDLRPGDALMLWWMAWVSLGMLLLSLGEGSPITQFLTQPWLRWVGKVSYGVYLYQGIIFVVVPLSVFPEWALMPIVVLQVAATFAIAAASYRYFERPIMDRRWPWITSGEHRLPSEAPLADTVKVAPLGHSSSGLAVQPDTVAYGQPNTINR